MITATLLTYVLSETYRSMTKVLIRSQKSIDFVHKREEILDFPVSNFTPIEIASKTYTEIIKTSVIAERVVKLLNLDQIKEEEGSGFQYYWRKAKTKTKDLLRKTWTILKYGRIKEEDAFSRAVAEVQGGLSVKPTKETYLFELQAEAKSGELSAAIANAAAKVFVAYLQEMSVNDMERQKRLSEDKVALSKEELNRAMNAVVEFKEKQRIVSLKNEAELEVKSISELENSWESVNAEINGLLAKKKEITRQLSDLKKFAKSEAKVIDNPLIRTLRTQLAEKEVRLAGLRERYTEEHREIQTLQTEISEIRSKLEKEAPTLSSEETLSIDPVHQELSLELTRAETQLESLRAKSNNLASVVREKKERIGEIPQKEAELAKLDLTAYLSEETHKLLSKEYEEVRMAAEKRAPDIKVIHNAGAPIYPFRPIKVYHAALAGILSLIVGLGIALLKEHLNVTIRTIDEAEQGLGLPVLMTVPYLRFVRGVSWPLIEDRNTGSASRLLPSFEEPIRGLRSDLQLWKSQQMFCFLMTSCGPQEGKSMIISNLAVSLATNNKRVVLIDANLRSPRLHEIFDLSNERGLTSTLAEGIPPWLQRDKTGLSVLTSGPSENDPPALLESNRMAKLLEFLKKDFDFILIDSPPLLAGPDAALLASIAEGTIIVLSAGRTSMEDAQRAKKILERAHAKILGVVLNHCEDGMAGYYRTNRKPAKASR